MRINKRYVYVAAGPLLFWLCYMLLPEAIFRSPQSRAAVGTVAWMALWWISAAVDYAVTGFLPIAVNAVVQMADMSAVLGNYASETIILLLGASILSASWEETGLDEKIAAFFLRILGSGFRTQIVFWFLLSALLSAVLPNAVVCATIIPIAVAMLKYIGEGDIAASRIGSKVLLTITYATGIGGLATPLGGAMNLVTVEYIEQLTGTEYYYLEWVIHFFPIVVVLVLANLIFLCRDVAKNEQIGTTAEYFNMKYEHLGKLSFEEKSALLLFLAATLLSFTRQLYQQYLPGLKPAYIFIICAIITFLITKSNGERIVVWKRIESKIVWELTYVFAGGLAAGALINESGAAEDLSRWMTGLHLTGGIGTIAVILLVTIVLSDFTSNTATAAIAMPIVIAISQGAGLDSIAFVYIASIGVNLSYMFPTSIRAIPVGYGLQPRYMLREGWKLTVISWVLMIACSWMMLQV